MEADATRVSLRAAKSSLRKKEEEIGTLRVEADTLHRQIKSQKRSTADAEKKAQELSDELERVSYGRAGRDAVNRSNELKAQVAQGKLTESRLTRELSKLTEEHASVCTQLRTAEAALQTTQEALDAACKDVQAKDAQLAKLKPGGAVTGAGSLYLAQRGARKTNTAPSTARTKAGVTPPTRRVSRRDGGEGVLTR